MSGSGYRITVKKFRFSPAGELEDTNLQINFQRAIPEGWVLALQSDNKVHAYNNTVVERAFPV